MRPKPERITDLLSHEMQKVLRDVIGVNVLWSKKFLGLILVFSRRSLALFGSDWQSWKYQISAGQEIYKKR